MPAHLGHLIICTNLGQICNIFSAKLVIIVKQIKTGTAPSKDPIWNEFSEHQSLKNHHI